MLPEQYITSTSVHTCSKNNLLKVYNKQPLSDTIYCGSILDSMVGSTRIIMGIHTLKLSLFNHLFTLHGTTTYKMNMNE